MQKQLGVGFIPYEIGDTVKFKDESIFDITDIRMVQYVNDKRVEFDVQVLNNYWISATEIIKKIN